MEKSVQKSATFKDYLNLTKPGIIFGNAVTAVGGYAFAVDMSFTLSLFLAMVEGLSCIIAAACIFNNVIDRKHDAKMGRTQSRPLAMGVIPEHRALLMGLTLLLIGTLVLAFGTNAHATSLALIGFFLYVFVYSFAKYQTIYGTHLGSLAGAIPPLVGYCAVRPTLDLGAWMLFAVIAFWQMPHFFAIAIYRMKDYERASIPVFPRLMGIQRTKWHMMLYLALFMGSTLLLPLLGLTTPLFGVVMSVVGGIWALIALLGFFTRDDERWARQMFLFSLFAVMAFSLMLSFCSKIA